MAVSNCTVTQHSFSAMQGTTIPAGVVNLTITSNTGEELDFSEFVVGGDGANVSEGITNVIFSNNPDGTINVAVYHGEITVQEAQSFHVDIDRIEISEPPPPPPPVIRGCTDPTANNYNPNANDDDGSCTYDPPPVIRGCTDPLASNYNPSATEDDGSCIIPVYGCTNPAANNYNPNATVDDNTCTFDPDPETETEGPCTGGSCVYEPLGRELELPFVLTHYPPAQDSFYFKPDYGNILVPDFWDYDWQVIDDLHPGNEGVVGQGVQYPDFFNNVGYHTTIVSILNLDTNEPWDNDGQITIPHSTFVPYNNWDDINGGAQTSSIEPITLTGEPLNLKFTLGICFKYYDSQGNEAVYNCTQDYFWSYPGDDEETDTETDTETEDGGGVVDPPIAYVDYTPKFYLYTVGGKSVSGEGRKDGGLFNNPFNENDFFFYHLDGAGNFPMYHSSGGGVHNANTPASYGSPDIAQGDFIENLNENGINEFVWQDKEFGDDSTYDWVTLYDGWQVPGIYPDPEQWYNADGSEKHIKIATFRYYASEGYGFTSETITLQESVNAYDQNMVGVFDDLGFSQEAYDDKMLYVDIDSVEYAGETNFISQFHVNVYYVPAKRIGWTGALPTLQTETKYNVFANYDKGPGVVVKPRVLAINTDKGGNKKLNSVIGSDTVARKTIASSANSKNQGLKFYGDPGSEFYLYIQDEYGKYYNTDVYSRDYDHTKAESSWKTEPPSLPIRLEGFSKGITWAFQKIENNSEPQYEANIWVEAKEGTELGDGVPTRENNKKIETKFLQAYLGHQVYADSSSTLVVNNLSSESAVIGNGLLRVSLNYSIDAGSYTTVAFKPNIETKVGGKETKAFLTEADDIFAITESKAPLANLGGGKGASVFAGRIETYDSISELENYNPDINLVVSLDSSNKVIRVTGDIRAEDDYNRILNFIIKIDNIITYS